MGQRVAPHEAARGDAAAKTKVLFALDQQSKLIDPVWGWHLPIFRGLRLGSCSISQS